MFYSIMMIISSPLDLQLLVKNLQFEDGKMIAAAQYFSAGSSAAVELTEEEKTFAEQMRVGTSKNEYLSTRKCPMLMAVFLCRLCGRVF